ncbi:MAG TPA: hypothetical protein VNX26_06455 [Candidatus Acidoferrum sp.]|nr:hypothetical protein [Candidatus Acidoferrum sp.]
MKQLAAILSEGEPIEWFGDEAKAEVHYSVKFSDGGTVDFNSVEDIIMQPNAKERSIISLAVTAEGQMYSAAIVLRGTPSPSVEYTVKSTQIIVVYMAQKLDEWVSSMREWYSLFQVPAWGIALLAAAFYVPIFLWNNASPYLFTEGLRTGKWTRTCFIVGLWVIEYLIVKLFPRATFAIGHGKKRHHFFTFLRNGVLGMFILSVIASVLANWMTRKF